MEEVLKTVIKTASIMKEFDFTSFYIVVNVGCKVDAIRLQKILNKLQAEGFINMHNNYYMVADIHKLRDLQVCGNRIIAKLQQKIFTIDC